MLYLKLDSEGQPERFPLEERHVREELNFASLPSDLTDEVLLPYGYAQLNSCPAEDVPKATKTHRVVVSGCVQRPNGQWERTYSSEEITEPHILMARLERKWTELRAEREWIMRDLSWRIERNEREQRLGLPLTDDLALLDKSMQLLADITENDDPFLVSIKDLVLV